jgi:hypothetical protein
LDARSHRRRPKASPSMDHQQGGQYSTTWLTIAMR